ncbi:MAG: carboxy terminal-processing peptidase [Taibaiella sp.]|nr:carboxy terminal-processing peptidase [Taibaiella sp.]
MKYKVLIPGIIVTAIIAFFSFRFMDTFSGTNAKNQHEVILKTVIKILENGHYSPKEINDSFSAQVFNKMFESLDYEKKFFLQSDVDELSKYKYQIDDQLKSNDITFFNELSQVFSKRLAQTEKYYQEILNKNFDFNAGDEYETDPEKLSFVKDEAALKARWNTNLKFRVLSKFYDLKKEQETKKEEDKSYKVVSDNELKKQAAESIIKVQERYFRRLKKFNDNERFAIFMNSITEGNDPHTTFMQPTDKKKFDELMSGSFIGIGATLQQQDDGRVKITSIVTGSPAWKQGSLKTDDIIEKVAQDEQTPVEVEGYDIEDIIKMIRGEEGTTVKLTVAKPDGSRQVIPIIRGKVDLENVFAKSSIIKEDGKKIGYIVLPEFYSNFNGISERKSSTDVEKEVAKLMDEGVDGIVLDLRNNGGGSLSDVVDIAGLFIGSGPVVQVKSSGNNTMTLRSKRPQPLYTGPLAVMINSGSASASEILAAAIQDYKRGVVIGSTSFGKGTVQKIISLDQFVSSQDRRMIMEQLKQGKEDAEFDGIGSLKITVQKFYRVNGGSTQLKGVEPDIYLPDAFELIDDIGEKKDKNALPWDKISAAEYNTFSNGKGISSLKSLSEKKSDRLCIIQVDTADSRSAQGKKGKHQIPYEPPAI